MLCRRPWPGSRLVQCCLFRKNGFSLLQQLIPAYAFYSIAWCAAIQWIVLCAVMDEGFLQACRTACLRQL